MHSMLSVLHLLSNTVYLPLFSDVTLDLLYFGIKRLKKLLIFTQPRVLQRINLRISRWLLQEHLLKFSKLKIPCAVSLTLVRLCFALLLF